MIQSSLNFNFPSNSLTDWQEAARQELEGVDPSQKLTIEVENLLIKAYYDQSTVQEKNRIALPAAIDEFLGARTWFNMPRVVVENEKVANKVILQHLNQGADGILIDLKNPSADASQLLKDVQLPYCAISILASPETQPFLDRFASWAENLFDVSLITGAIYHTHAQTISRRFEQWKKFCDVGIIGQSSLPIPDQLADVLSRAIQWGEKLDQNFVSRTAFLIPVGPNFFLEIAKNKVLKILWAAINHAYGITTANPVWVHAQSEAWISPAYEPHGNLIKQTTAGLAAVLGGCDALTTESDLSSETTSRIARNVSSILREESQLARVADPTAGSYYLESLVQQLSKKAWEKFLKRIDS